MIQNALYWLKVTLTALQEASRKVRITTLLIAEHYTESTEIGTRKIFSLFWRHYDDPKILSPLLVPFGIEPVTSKISLANLISGSDLPGFCRTKHLQTLRKGVKQNIFYTTLLMKLKNRLYAQKIAKVPGLANK